MPVCGPGSERNRRRAAGVYAPQPPAIPTAPLQTPRIPIAPPYALRLLQPLDDVEIRGVHWVVRIRIRATVARHVETVEGDQPRGVGRLDSLPSGLLAGFDIETPDSGRSIVVPYRDEVAPVGAPLVQILVGFEYCARYGARRPASDRDDRDLTLPCRVGKEP